MLLAEEGGVIHLAGVGSEGDDVEVLPVGRAAVGVGRGLHARGAVGVPVGEVGHEVAPPSGGIHAVADVGSKGRGREVDSPRCAEEGAPTHRRQVGREVGQQHAGIGDAVGRIDDKRGAGILRLSVQKHLVVPAYADEIQLVVASAPQERRGHHPVAVVRQLAHKSVGRAAAVGGLQAPRGDGEVLAGGAATDQQVVGRVYVDAVHRVVHRASQIGAPQHRTHIVVQLEHHALLAAARGRLHRARGGGEVGAESGAAHIDVVQVVGDQLSARSVAIVIVQRVVAAHVGHTLVVVRLVVEAVVAAATHKGGSLQLAAVSAEAAHEDVAPLRESNLLGTLVEDVVSSRKRSLEGAGSHREVVRAGGAEYNQLVETVDKHAVRHVGPRAAQIGGIEALGAGGVEFEDAYVAIAARTGLVGTQRHRVAHTEHQPRRVYVLLRVVGRRRTPVVGRRAGVGREHQHRVDHQVTPMVIGIHLNPHLPPLNHFPTLSHSDFLTFDSSTF